MRGVSLVWRTVRLCGVLCASCPCYWGSSRMSPSSSAFQPAFSIIPRGSLAFCRFYTHNSRFPSFTTEHPTPVTKLQQRVLTGYSDNSRFACFATEHATAVTKLQQSVLTAYSDNSRFACFVPGVVRFLLVCWFSPTIGFSYS